VSNHDWSEPPGPHPPPGPLPDGSIPLYGSYPLPGMPGGDPALPLVGWGPEIGGGPKHFQHGGPQPKRRRTGLAISLLLLGGVAVAVVIAALALRDDAVTTVAPAPGVGLASIPTAAQTSPAVPDDSPPGTGGDGEASQEAMRVVTADAFYTTGAQGPVGCREPQVALSTPEAVKAYYANLIGCLNRAWSGKVRSGDDTYTAPRVVFWSGQVQSPCAGGSSVSFYCGASQTIYLKFEADIKLWTRASDPSNRAFARMWATYTAGREFAHHLQQLTGIQAAAQQLEYDAPDRDAQLELSRRVELQASCLGTVFMGANKLSYGITGLDLTIYRRYVEAQTGDENNRGGPRDHGARASQQYWTARGFNTFNSAYCNTFTASASKVS
jgi:predicted metalloprotease